MKKTYELMNHICTVKLENGKYFVRSERKGVLLIPLTEKFDTLAEALEWILSFAEVD